MAGSFAAGVVHGGASKLSHDGYTNLFFCNPQLYRPSFHHRSKNPPVKDRVACVNKRLRNQANERHISIDPSCKQLIADLEQVHWKTDVSGNSLSEIDKSDPKRTHLSDALGYMIELEFPMKPKAGERPYSIF